METQQGTALVNTGTIGAFAGPGGTALNIMQQLYAGFAPEMLHESIATVLDHFRRGETEIAKGQLSVIRKLGNQDPRISASLDVVSIYLDLVDSKDATNIRKQLIDFLAQSSNNDSSLLTDLCMASLLRLAGNEGHTDDIRSMWKSFSSPGSHAKETFYALAATEKELKDVIASGGLLLVTEELRGIVEGAIRLKEYGLAADAVDRLLKVDQSPNTQFLKASIDASLLQVEINNVHFWSVSATVHDKVIELAGRVTALFSLKQLADTRLPLMSARLLMYAKGEVPELAKVCWEHITLIEKAHPECAALLHFANTSDISHLPEAGQRLMRAENDLKFRKECVEEVISKKSLSIEDALMVMRYASAGQLTEWLGKGEISSEVEEAVVRDLILLYIHARSIESRRQMDELNNLRQRYDAFVHRHVDRLRNLNVEPILEIATQLNALGLSAEACNLLEKVLPPDDFWPSPLFKCYIYALAYAGKDALLDTVLQKVPEDHWTVEILVWKARLQSIVGNLTGERAFLRRAAAIKISARVAVLLVDVLDRLGERNEAKDVLKDSSPAILFKDDGYAIRLIVEMFKHDLQEKAEAILLDWFFDGPDSCAIAISQIFNSLITDKEPIVFAQINKDSIRGVQYYDGKNSLTKLVVPPEIAQGQYFISTTSPLGERLLNVGLGESFKEGIITYKLEERMPSIVAVFRIASSIRDNMNAGNDPFHVLNVSTDDPKKLLDQLLEITTPSSKEFESVVKLDSMPLMFKGHFLKRSKDFEAALGALHNKEIKKFLPVLGFENEIQPLVLDVYAVAFLASTGLVSGLLAESKSVYITVETEVCLREWLADRDRTEGGVLGTLSNGMPYLITVEQIRRETQDIADQVNLLLNSSEILYPQLADMRTELINWREFLDPSVFSTLRIASTRDIAWLCVDTAMAQTVSWLGCKVVKNVPFLLEKYSRQTAFNNRRHGLYRHPFVGLPTPILKNDLYELSKDEDKTSVVVLAKILRMYPNIFPTAEDASRVLTELLLNVFSRACMRGEFDFYKGIDHVTFPSHVKILSNAAFYIVAHAEKGKSCERNVAVFIHTIVNTISPLVDSLFAAFIEMIASLAGAFLRGHFMQAEVVKNYLDAMNTGKKI